MDNWHWQRVEILEIENDKRGFFPTFQSCAPTNRDPKQRKQKLKERPIQEGYTVIVKEAFSKLLRKSNEFQWPGLQHNRYISMRQ